MKVEYLGKKVIDLSVKFDIVKLIPVVFRFINRNLLRNCKAFISILLDICMKGCYKY